MPSLRSIGVHPQLEEKLAALEPSIETPQALLSRDPASLAHALKVPLHIVDSVRSAVADALIASTRDGKRSLRISATIQEDDELEGNRSVIVGSISALDYIVYQQETCTAHPISSGSERLDKLLGIDDFNPGLAFGNVTELTGTPSSGKTQVALALAAQQAHRGGKVFYLASGFGHGTIVPLARRLSHYTNKEDYHHVLSNIYFTPVMNGYQALALLLQLEEDHLVSNVNGEGFLVIMDSASGILAGDLYASGDGDAGIIIARQVALQLKKMVRNYNVAALVTNGTVSGDKGNKAALGQVWRVADIHLWLEVITFDETAPFKVIRCSMEKHPHRPWHRKENNEMAEFGITTGGIVDLHIKNTVEGV